MNKWRICAAVLALAVPVGIGFLPSASTPPAPVLPPATDQSAVCPVGLTPTTMLAKGAGRITSTPLGGTASEGTTAVRLTNQSGAVLLASESRFVAGSHVTSGTAMGWSRCLLPRTNGVLQFVEPKASDLLLMNADDAEAAVDLTLYGPSGEIEAVGSRGLTVPAHSTRIVPISVLAAVDDPVGVRIKATAGRVAAVGRTWSTSAGDFINATQPERTQLIAGVPGSSSDVRVLITNPGTDRVTADVTAFTTQAVALAGAQGVDIEPGQTRAFDVTQGIGDAMAALRVTANEPVVASMVAKGPVDYAVSPATGTVLTGRLVVPAGGTLSLTNPSEVQASVTLTTTQDGAQPVRKTVAIAAGQTWSEAAPTGNAVVVYDVLATSPVIGAITVLAANGAYVAPLESMAAPSTAEVTMTYDTSKR